MKPDTLTERLYAQADAKLRKRLDESLKWIWDESERGSNRPKNCVEFPKLVEAMSALGWKKENLEGKEAPWIYSVQNFMAETCFAYLRDKYRNAEVSEFMGKVNSMAQEFESLGIAIEQNQQQ